MSTYAKHTTVPVDRSRAAVEKALVRYGATGFGYHWDRREVPILPPRVNGPKTEIREFASIIFQVKARRVRLDVPMPTEREAGTQAKAEAATRQRWRAVLLVITAKLEAVESGISTLEAEFLANIVTDDGRTIGEAVLPRLTEAVQSGRLLPAAGKDA
jgi:hypothetical protein